MARERTWSETISDGYRNFRGGISDNLSELAILTVPILHLITNRRTSGRAIQLTAAIFVCIEVADYLTGYNPEENAPTTLAEVRKSAAAGVLASISRGKCTGAA